jgi:hypothetical protein
MSKIIKIAVFVILLADMTVVPAFAGPVAQSDKTPPVSEIEVSIDKTPKAVFPELIYSFTPVYEGVAIKHDFIVANRGDAPLIIKNVRPDCGCSVATNPGQIPAGEEGKISIMVKTNNHGGGKLHKGFTVYTNDHSHEQVRLEVTGDVIADLTVFPRQVRLTGAVGQPLRQTVKIIPLKGHPFTIKEVKARGNLNIRYQLKPLGGNPGVAGYELVVENSFQKAGDYRDMISIKTDSKEKPSIIIPVLAHIQKATGK